MDIYTKIEKLLLELEEWNSYDESGGPSSLSKKEIDAMIADVRVWLEHIRSISKTMTKTVRNSSAGGVL